MREQPLPPVCSAAAAGAEGAVTQGRSPVLARARRRPLIAALGWAVAGGVFGCAALLPGLSPAQQGAPAPASAPGAKPGLKLDSILRPRSLPSAPAAAEGGAIRGGRSRQQWVETFAALREEIRGLESQLEVSRMKLSASAGGNEYQYSPLGGGTASDPEVLKLRAQLRRDRETLDAAERRLRDLEVEASLSGVPREWFEPKEKSPPSP